MTALICDFGGVLTTPLYGSFLAVQDRVGVSPEAFGRAMESAGQETGSQPLHELETGRMTEADFLGLLARHLEPELGHRPELHAFREIFFEALQPNEPMLALVREARDAGLRSALCTNNVREWEDLWREMFPVDELFEFVVDSAFVGVRKPDAGIYELCVEGFGGEVAREDCVLVDDLEVNCDGARRAGLRAVHYRPGAEAEVREALGLGAP